MGVADPDRVGVGGHSYGAFMTANLLAHCDLFRAGVARAIEYGRAAGCPRLNALAGVAPPGAAATSSGPRPLSTSPPDPSPVTALPDDAAAATVGTDPLGAASPVGHGQGDVRVHAEGDLLARGVHPPIGAPKPPDDGSQRNDQSGSVQEHAEQHRPPEEKVARRRQHGADRRQQRDDGKPQYPHGNHLTVNAWRNIAAAGR